MTCLIKNDQKMPTLAKLYQISPRPRSPRVEPRAEPCPHHAHGRNVRAVVPCCCWTLLNLAVNRHPKSAHSIRTRWTNHHNRSENEGFVVRTPTWAISETQGSRFASHTFVKKCCMANSGVLLKGKWRMCTGTTQPSKGVSLFGKVPSLTSCSHNFWKPMSVPYMFSCGSFCGGAYLINYSAWQVTNKILLETIHRIGKVLQSDTGYPLKKPTTLQLKGKNFRHTTSNHSLSFD